MSLKTGCIFIYTSILYTCSRTKFEYYTCNEPAIKLILKLFYCYYDENEKLFLLFILWTVAITSFDWPVYKT